MNRVLNEETGISNRMVNRDDQPTMCLQLRRRSRLLAPILSVAAMAVVMPIAAAFGPTQLMAADGTPADSAPAESPATAEQEKPDSQLPYGYKPPAVLPPGASSDEEWIVQFGDGGKRATDNARRDFLSVFNRGNFESAEDRENFDKYVQWRLSQFTLRKYLTANAQQQQIGAMRSKWLRDVDRARKASPTIFQAYVDTLVRETPKLFKYHMVARLNAAVLLAELNETPEENNKPAVPLLAVTEPLLDFLGQENQLGVVRVPAVRGLARVIRDGQPPEKLRDDIITAFVNELQNGDPKNDELATTIAEELGRLGIINGSDRTPVVVNALTKALADKKRGYRSRSEAAAALGRLSLDNTINVRLIAFEIAALAQEMADAFQKEAANAVKNEQKPDYVAWKKSFYNLYLAFKGDTRANIERGHGLSNKDGLNGAIKQTVNSAYGQVLPLILSILVEKPIDSKDQDAILQWIQANTPQSRKVHDSFQEIISDDQSRAPGTISSATASNTDANN
ncbi:hypothetical protein CA54_02830 [Symmachiella macrocystis]|uniref:Uncharacterized protein n=1 Tax=Symmachiella macrocystis TaxID=2527985 RepID=A0A5C6BJF8_9PLAN|nr:hypothetical protein [Symmachiella macrocystis]TWU11476.1 hypothetical protein CA54_02830 [Symmachiella macrocystis]